MLCEVALLVVFDDTAQPTTITSEAAPGSREQCRVAFDQSRGYGSSVLGWGSAMANMNY